MGSRYGGLKQLDAFGPNGETLLEYSVYDAWQAGFTRVVFVIRDSFAGEFDERIGQPVSRRLHVSYAYQQLDDFGENGRPAGVHIPSTRQKPWGTGHALLAARHAVSTPFAVINADDYYGPGSYRVLAAFLNDANAAPADIPVYGLVGYRIDHTLSAFGTVSRGVCEIDDDGDLFGIDEVHGIHQGDGQILAGDGSVIDPATPVSLNLFGFPASFFGALDRGFRRFIEESAHDPKAEFYLPAAVTDEIAEERAEVNLLRTDEQWFGVTYPDDKTHTAEMLSEAVASGRYPESLWG